MRLEIIRFEENSEQTISKFIVFDDWNCEIAQGFMLELDDENNERRVSRIPEGEYECVKRWSEKYKDHFHILDVPNRDYILIHIGNYHTDTKGCLLPGQSIVDINGDGHKDVTSSGATMRMLNRLLPDEFTVVITNQIENGEV
jgi:hypothetical protein